VGGRGKESKVVRGEITSIRVFQIGLVVLGVGLSAGCESKLTTEARAGINSVTVNWDGSLPERMEWGHTGGGGGTPALAAVFLSAELAGLPEKVRRRRAIGALMRKNKIEPGEILEAQFRKQLEAKQVFSSIVNADGDATFTLDVWSYGLLWDSRGVSWPPYPLKPVLTVNVYLRKPDGTLVWENNAWTSDFTDGVDARMYEEYVENPDLLRKGFEQAASKIASQFLKNIETD
jgi:hypothetical protein